MATFEVDQAVHPAVAEYAADVVVVQPVPSAIVRGVQDAAIARNAETLVIGRDFHVVSVGFFAQLADTIPPNVLAGEVISPVTVDVGFSEEMIGGASLLTGWASSDPLVPVQSAQQIGPYRVRLSIGEMLEGKVYTFTCPATAQDLAGNLVSARTATIVGVGGRPSITEVQRILPTRLRVKFSEPMHDDGDLRSPQSYSVLPAATGAPVFVGAAEPEAVEFPTFVDITVTEQTIGQNYNVGASAVKDRAGNVVTAATASVVGVGAAPRVRRVDAIGANRVDVIIDEPVQVNADTLNPAKYTWTGGLTTVAVLSVDGARIKLTTSDQTPGTVYTLTITP